MRISDWSSDVCSSDLSIGANWTIRATYTHRETDQESLLFAGGSGYPNRDGSGLGVWDYYGVTEQQEDSVDVYASGKFSLFGREHELVLGGTWYDRDFTVNSAGITDRKSTRLNSSH